MKNTKRSLTTSVIILFLCFSMLLGTTYAWFTDSASSAGNIIQSGNLDIKMHWSEDLVDWSEVSGDPIFTHDNWEPGYTEIKYIKVENAGNLSFKWKLNIEAEGRVGELAEVIDVYYVNPVSTKITTLVGQTSVGVLSDVIANKTATEGVLLPVGTTPVAGTPDTYLVGETVLAIAFHMDENAGNKYQKQSVGDGFTVSLVATQVSYESDAFGNTYDQNATWPGTTVRKIKTARTAVDVTADNKVANEATMAADGVSAIIPAGVKLDAGVSEVVLNIAPKNDSAANVVLNDDEKMASIDVHIEGVAEDNEVVMTITQEKLLPKYLNMGNYRFYHVEDGATVEMTLREDGATPVHNNYDYDPATGDVVLYLKSFSEVALIAENESKWEGGYDYSWYTDLTWDGDVTNIDTFYIASADQLAGLSAIVGGMNGQTRNSFAGKTIKLLCDINFNDIIDENGKVFYPIGYYNSTGSYDKVSGAVDGNAVASSFNSFEGTFDGNGNTVKNFYQNTWEMFGDYNDGYSGTPNHYKDGMGLFGYVYNGTVKNLTIENFKSDGEFTPTGCVAAFACNATFKNIAIVNCNPRVYNTGNGGIVGIGGNDSDPDSFKLTFENISVDKSNIITALWGSWDVACGGLVGMYRGAGHAYMNNCHVAAQIDVFNDVCGNYQYYWYRYAGMLIGTNKNMKTDANGYTVPETEKYHVSNCTVHFDSWNDYYYCELVANSLASYTHDHQMSRLTQVKEINGTTITYLDGSTGKVPASGRANYVVVNGTPSTENATCYHFLNGEVWDHKQGGNETTDIDGDGVVDSNVYKEDKQHLYLPFNQLFTGYGWGVKHVPINGYAGVDILDETRAGSVEKFTALKNNGIQVAPDGTYEIGKLFADVEVEGFDVKGDRVQVTVSPVIGTYGDDQALVEAEYTPNNDWTKGTIKFVNNVSGWVDITITDYDRCIPTTIRVQVGNPDDNGSHGEIEIPLG